MSPAVWEPRVTVLGLGEQGAATVATIDTPTGALVDAVVDGDDLDAVSTAVAGSDFLFVTGAVGRGASHGGTVARLDLGDVHVTVLPESTSGGVGAVLEAADLLVPVDPSRGRRVVAGAIAALFECMLPPTVGSLGHADVRWVARTDRIGTLSIHPLDGRALADGAARMPPAGDDRVVDLSPGVTVGAPDAVVAFLCGVGPRRPGLADAVDVTEPLGVPADATFLRDQRVHPRYAGGPHVVALLATDAPAARRRRALSTRR